MIVSGVNDPRTIRALLDGGARGYIPKLASSEQLMDALRRVLRGEVYLPDALFIPDAQNDGARRRSGTADVAAAADPAAARGRHAQQADRRCARA